MIKYAALFVFLAVANAETMLDRNIIEMGAGSLRFFNQEFRQALLRIIKTEMKDAIDMSNILSDLNDQCQKDMLSQSQQCNSCIPDDCFMDEEYIEALDSTISIVEMLEDMINKLADAVELLGDNAAAFLNEMREFRFYASENAHQELWMTLDELEEKINEVVNNIASDVDNAIGDVGEVRNGVANGIKGDSYGYLERRLDGLGDKFGNGFGDYAGFDTRKRRSIDDATRQCMEKCDLCYPLLLETKTERITAVCGSDIIVQNQTLTSLTQKIRSVYSAVVDRYNPMVSEIHYEMLSKNSRMQRVIVVITVHLNAEDTITYQAEVPYQMWNFPNTAREMAIEYWDRAN